MDTFNYYSRLSWQCREEFKDPAAIRQGDTDEDATSRAVAEGICLLSCYYCVEKNCFVCQPDGRIEIRGNDRITLRRHGDVTFRAMPGKLVMNFEEKEKGDFEVDMVKNRGRTKEIFIDEKNTPLPANVAKGQWRIDKAHDWLTGHHLQKALWKFTTEEGPSKGRMRELVIGEEMDIQKRNDRIFFIPRKIWI